MIRRHVVESGLIALCVILTAIVLMMWWASCTIRPFYYDGHDDYDHFGLNGRELSTKYYFNLACNRPNNDW